MKNNIRKIVSLIPQSIRGKTYVVIATSVARALLNFIGLAAVLPVLLLILDPDGLMANLWVKKIFYYLHFSSINHLIIGICITVFVIYLIKNSLNIFIIHFQNKYYLQLYHYFTNLMFVDYFHRDLTFMKQNHSITLTHRVNTASISLVFNVLSSMVSIVSEVILIFLLFFTILYYNPLVALLLIVVFFPISFLYLFLVKQKLENYGREEYNMRRQQNRLINETFKGYTEIILNKAFASIKKRFMANLEQLKFYKLKNENISNFPFLLIEMGVVTGMIIFVLINLYTGENTSKVLFGVFAIAALRMLPAIRTIVSRWLQIKYNQYSIDIISENINNKIDEKEEICQNRLRFQQFIRLEDISYTFEDDLNTPVIDALSFTIKKGECVGIKGATGVGKTTLFYLLMGFYFPKKGNIYIDNEELTTENLKAWQNIIAYVSQEVFIMDATFAQNIAMTFDEDKIDRSKVNKVLEITKLQSLINLYPDGIDAKIGEIANRLSGGEKQRIGIARALYKEAEILFFDEATSSLDMQTERDIQLAIQQLIASEKNLTILMITHRETSLKCCSKIIDIENKQIINT